MVALVQRHTDHDSIDEWLTQLSGYLSGDVDPGTFADSAGSDS